MLPPENITPASVSAGAPHGIAESAPHAVPRPPISGWHVAAALVIVLAAVVRLWAADGDLWLDEIWSYGLTGMIDAPWKVFTQVRHDNNHHLISLWISLLGFEVAPPMVRAPSIFAGIGTVLLAAAIARRWGLHAMLIATVLTGSSYVTINYSAEARGYSLAGFFALAAFLALERYLDTNRWQPLLLFWMLVPLGFFSHLTFLHFYCGAVIWSVARWLRCGLYGRALLAKTAFCHAWPLLFLVTFYFVSLRGMEIGGGDRPSFPAVIVKALSLSVGGPIALSSDQLLIALLAAGGGIAALVLMYRDGSDLWAFFLTTIFLSPLFLLVEQPHSGLFVRYFFVNIVFNLLLITYLLGARARLVRSAVSPAWRWSLRSWPAMDSDCANSRPAGAVASIGRRCATSSNTRPSR